MSVKVSYPLFDISVRWLAFRNLSVSRKVKAILRLSGKIYGMCQPSHSDVCASFSVRSPYSVGWWHVRKLAEDSSEVYVQTLQRIVFSLVPF